MVGCGRSDGQLGLQVGERVFFFCCCCVGWSGSFVGGMFGSGGLVELLLLGFFLVETERVEVREEVVGPARHIVGRALQRWMLGEWEGFVLLLPSIDWVPRQRPKFKVTGMVNVGDEQDKQ